MRRHCESKCSDIKNYIVSVSIVFVVSLSRSTRSTHILLLLFLLILLLFYYYYYYFVLLHSSLYFLLITTLINPSPTLNNNPLFPLNVPSCLRVQYVFSPFLVVGFVFYSCSSWNVHYSLFVSLLMPLCFVSAIYAQKRSTYLSLLSVVCVQTLNVSTSHFSTLSSLDWQLFS